MDVVRFPIALRDFGFRVVKHERSYTLTIPLCDLFQRQEEEEEEEEEEESERGSDETRCSSRTKIIFF